MSAARHSGIDLAVLRDALLDDIETVAEALLGPRNRTLSTRRTWRWGSKGSLALEITGPKRGRWFSHEAGQGGGPIDLVCYARRCDFADAASWGADFTGISATSDAERVRYDETRRREHVERQTRRAAEEADERAARIARLRRRLHHTVTVNGTLGERYLIDTRCIPRPPGGWPDVLRYDPHDKALVVIATDANSELQAAQWIHLTDDARKAKPTDEQPTKLTRGPVKGAAVRLPGRPSAPLQIAEGPETGLSLWVSTGCETWIALGSIANLPTPPVGRAVVACLDDDPRFESSARVVRKTLGKWRRHGVQCVVAKPWAIRREDKSDFNDVLCAHGTGAVEERILYALEPAGYHATPRPVHVAVARERLRKHFAEEADAVLASSDAQATATRMGAGGGKSGMAIAEGVRVVCALRACGDMHTVAIATPRGDLNHKHAARANMIAPAVTVAVYHGADADNPDAPGEKMCRNPEDRRAAEIRGLDPTKLICPACPMRPGCAYRAQAARRADIWLVPHNLLFMQKPRAIGDLAWLIVDENPVAAALIGVGDLHAPNPEDRPLFLTVDTLRRADRVKGDAVDTERLHAARSQLIGALEASPNTNLMRAALIEAGLTADTCEQAIGLEYATKIQPATDDGMALQGRLAELREADANCDLDRRVMLWREAAALLRGEHETAARAEIVTLHEAKGMVRAVRSKGRRMIGAGWGVRTTIIDATLQPDLLRQIWPNVAVHDLGVLDAPHRHVVQVVDRAFSLAMLDAGDPRIDAKERKRREANLRRLHVTLARLIRDYHLVGSSQRVLIVAQKRIVDHLQALGSLPGNIDWAHHGAVTGRDDWRDVRAVIVVGRSLPPPSAVEAQAEALTGAPIARLPHGAWYPLIDATRELVDGSSVACETVRHPDPIAEAFRWRACEGELEHIIERARGVNRQSDAERVDVVVLTDAPLQMPVETMISTDDIAPRAEDRMLAAQGVTLTASEDAARAYPKLWRNGNAVRVLRHREREHHGRDWQPPPGLVHARYRRALNGAHHGTAVFDPAMVPDITAWLRSALGELTEVALIAPLQAPIRCPS